MTEAAEKRKVTDEKEPSSFRLIITLGIIGFFSGVILVSSFLYTRPIIQQHRAEALRAAIYEVLPGTSRFETLELREGRLVKVEATEETQSGNEDAPQIYAGYNDSDELTGFAISSEEAGYQDLIVGIFGYDPQKEQVVGFKVLESKETPGLGDKIMKDENFQANFRSLAVDPEIVVVPNGEKTQDNQVEAITGATISSKAVVGLVEKGLAEWRPLIREYVER